MADVALIVNAQMRALIGRLGCLDAAAAAIQARTGSPTGKGTLTKRLHGQLGWLVSEVAALEDALGDYPVTRMLARRIAGEASPVGMPLTVCGGTAAREAGEAVAAALAVETSVSASDYAAAIVEADEAIQAMTDLKAAIVAKMEGRTKRREGN